MAQAVKFLPNRVWRVYSGGSGIDKMRGDFPEKDGHFPEDWIASTAIANNPQYDKPGQGLSYVESNGRSILFSEYLAADPQGTLGEKHFRKFGANAALLMKILDAAEQLPIQCHPTVADAEKYFNSRFGKTEMWYITGVRQINGQKPYLLAGFNETLNVEVFKQEAFSGTFSAGEKMLHKFEVSPGDCLLIRGGLPHAIGCGVTLIEVMEPSDLVIQPELFCGEQPLSDAERWSGASPENAMKCFDYSAESFDEFRKKNVMQPENIDESLQIVVPRRLAKFFEVQKLCCRQSYKLVNRENCHRAGVVTGGELLLDDGTQQISLKSGDAFFLPYAFEEMHFSGNGDIVFALPPETE